MKFKKGQLVELINRAWWNGERYVFRRGIIEAFWKGVRAFVVWVADYGVIDEHIYRIVVAENDLREIDDEEGGGKNEKIEIGKEMCARGN